MEPKHQSLKTEEEDMKPERIQPPESITHNDAEVERGYAFESFAQAMAFVGVVATAAQALGIYPDVEVVGATVTLCIKSDNPNDLERLEAKVAESYITAG